jgi:hypothetical protein
MEMERDAGRKLRKCVVRKVGEWTGDVFVSEPSDSASSGFIARNLVSCQPTKDRAKL